MSHESRVMSHEITIIRAFLIMLTIHLSAIFVGSIIKKDWFGALGILEVDSGILILLYIALKTTPKVEK